MPRGPGGGYTLPAGNPVVPGTIIESDWANPTMSDIGQELTDSLSRSGKGGMLAALRGLDGSAAVPTFSFTNEPATGRYRAGPGQVVESVDGVPVVRYLSTGLEQWDPSLNGGLGDWIPLTPRDAAGTPFNPDPSNLTSTNVQAAIEEVNAKTGGTQSADTITYDDTNVYFPAGNVQQAIDRLGNDLAGQANDILDNADAILIVQGELDLLTQRVTLNEQNIGDNTTRISLLETTVGDNDSRLDVVEGDISNIKLEQITQNSDIDQNATDILFTYNITQDNADAISVNVQDISQNAADIATNLLLIQDIEDRFTSKVLQVAHGGTGVTTATGTGSVVRKDNPFIDFASLGSCIANTMVATDYSQAIATTEYVRNAITNLGLEARYGGSNGNGSWVWFPGTENMILQYGYVQQSGANVVRNFPVAHNNSFPIQFSIQQVIDGYNGPWGTAPIINGVSQSQFSVATDHHFYWISIGAYT